MLLGQGPESSGLAPFTWESVPPVGAENPVTSSLMGETGKEMEQPRPVEPTVLPELEARRDTDRHSPTRNGGCRRKTALRMGQRGPVSAGGPPV